MRSDRHLQQDVIDELRYEPSLDEKEIGVNTRDGIVTMTGRVKNYAEKLSAVRAVERVLGVKAIVDELKVVPLKGTERTDVEIAQAAVRALDWEPSIPKDRVKAKIEAGWLTLEGKLDWQYQRAAAERAVHRLEGVRGVTNLIRVEPPVKAFDVRSKIAAALARSAALHAQEIKVETVDRTVMLRGTVHSWEDRREAEQAAWSAPGVSQVENDLTIIAPSPVAF